MDRSNAGKAARSVADAAAWTTGSILRAILKVLATLLLIFITTGLLFTCIFAFYVKNSLSTDMQITIEDFEQTLTTSIYYMDKSTGNYELLTTLYDEKNTVWVDYKMIPRYMEYAAVAIEDKRFYEHKGVDWYRTVAAFGNMFLSMKNDFGGSTITQQLIKNLTEEDEVTVQRKLLEIFRALEVEKNYTKEQIVTWYLNSIYLGERCYGVGTAAQTYFGKEVWQLSLAECASLVGITNNPSRYDPFVPGGVESNKSRQELILFQMYEQGYITFNEYQTAVNEELIFQRTEDDVFEYVINSYYVDAIIRDVLKDLKENLGVSDIVASQMLYGHGLQIYSCIDMDIQKVVDDVYEHPDQLPKSYGFSNQQLQSAIVIMDTYSGDIVAMSGGVGEKTINLGFDRANIARRPPGSSFKPLAVYGPALERGLITQNTLVSDAPGTLSGTTWFPRNANWGYSGIVTIREAVRASINTVAAQTLDLIGLDVSYQFLTERLGFKDCLVISNENNQTDIAYSPLSLGQLTNGATVREMAQGYTSFANDGTFTYGRTYTHIINFKGTTIIDNSPKQIQAFQPETARNMTDMLVNAVNYGTGTEARLPDMMVAGKTGTTTNNMDRYFVGFTPYYVAAVWTGYDTPAVMQFSGNPAAQIWENIMKQIHNGLEYKAFPAPASRGVDTKAFGLYYFPPEEEDEDSDDQTTDSPDTTDNPDNSAAPQTPQTSTPVENSDPTVTPGTSTPAPDTTPPVNEPDPLVPTPTPYWPDLPELPRPPWAQ